MSKSLNESIKCFLLDIEGTTTPINFVHKTLFPYAKAKIGEFVEAHFGELANEIEQLEKEYHKDFANQLYGRNFSADSAETVANYLKYLIEVDRKSTPLKTIQGKIWQTGYESGELVSEIFADVPQAFERWKTEGKTIAIFSSGSVLAQKLIFKHSNFGDLSGFISNYFDTNIGAKKQGESYVKIATTMNHPQKRVAFVSDVTAELDAAKVAGLCTFLSIREGNGIVQPPINHNTVASFKDLYI